jgi:Na+-transporting methylmalonyl-CoA/oxaloacetate decarboxylase beta subunit
MKTSLYKKQIIMFIVMVIIGMLFNPMNILSYKISDLYISQTLFYSGLLMASNMIWAHEIVHYLSMGHFNMLVFSVGIILSISVSILLLRQQLLVDDKQWLRRMIGHHSTAITTTKQLLKKRHIMKNNTPLYRLAKDIVYNQEREIFFMKTML